MESLPYASLLGYSLAGVAAVGLIEKFIPVMPSYVMLVLFGMTLVGDNADLSAIILCSAAGSIIGGFVWYSFGRLIGPERTDRFVARFGRYFFLSPDLYERLSNAYERNHFWVTTIGQVVPTARIYLALPAGVIGLPLAPFFIATAIGTLAWNGPLITLGYLLQNSGWSPVTAGTIAVVSLITIEAIVIFAVFRRRKAHSGERV
jgi:membrane protein DedA with SNARE-associated domain